MYSYVFLGVYCVHVEEIYTIKYVTCKLCRCKLDNKGFVILCLSSDKLGLSVLSNTLGYGTNINIPK